MPYYFASAIQGWARTCFEDPLNETDLRDSDIVFFVDDIMGWMNKNYGEAGDCECERNPKSNTQSYMQFAPKSTDKTKIGMWLRNFMDMTDIAERDITDNIIETIYDDINMDSIEKLFHSMDTDDQREFRDYVSSNDRFSDESDNNISDFESPEDYSSDSDMSDSDMSEEEDYFSECDEEIYLTDDDMPALINV